MCWPMYYHGIFPDVLVDVPTDIAVIERRDVGNDAEKINHRCEPNARLLEESVLLEE